MASMMRLNFNKHFHNFLALSKYRFNLAEESIYSRRKSSSESEKSKSTQRDSIKSSEKQSSLLKIHKKRNLRLSKKIFSR